MTDEVNMKTATRMTRKTKKKKKTAVKPAASQNGTSHNGARKPAAKKKAGGKHKKATRDKNRHTLREHGHVEIHGLSGMQTATVTGVFGDEIHISFTCAALPIPDTPVRRISGNSFRMKAGGRVSLSGKGQFHIVRFPDDERVTVTLENSSTLSLQKPK